jgi:hypothetical protein
MSVETGAPRDMLAAHPETAYFWGRVAADGECEAGCVTVRTNDETAARRLTTIAGGERADERIVEREYAHDTALTRREEEYTVQVLGTLSDRASAALGLPFEGTAGGYRFDAIAEHDRQLLRGLLEGCGTVCLKSDEPAVGISFVHEDEDLLRTIQSILDRIPVEAPHDDLAAASSGHWFGIADAAAPEFGEWLYEGSEESGLFAPSRRRKLQGSIDRVRDS